MALSWERRHLPDILWFHKREDASGAAGGAPPGSLLLESDTGAATDALLLESDTGAGTSALLLENA